MRVEGPDEDVVIKLYNTDIIRYKKDGTITLNNGGWATETTHKVLREITGMNVYTHRHVSIVSCFVAEPLTNTVAAQLPNGKDVVFRHTSPDYRSPLNLTPTLPIVHRVKRKEMNAVRRKYKPAIHTMQGILKVRGEGFKLPYGYGLSKGGYEGELAPFIEAFGATKEKRWICNATSGKSEPQELDWPVMPLDYEASCRCVTNKGVGYGADWHKKHGAAHEEFMSLLTSEDAGDHYKALLWMSSASPYNNGIDNPNKVIRALDKVLMRMYRDEVFEEIEVQSGHCMDDPYAKYFN
jgi:hypothetical protein